MNEPSCDILHHNLSTYVSDNKLVNDPAYQKLRKAAIEFENKFNEILFIHVQNYEGKNEKSTV